MGRVGVDRALRATGCSLALLGLSGRDDFTIGDIDVLWPKKLAERLTPKEPLLDAARIEAVHRALASAL